MSLIGHLNQQRRRMVRLARVYQTGVRELGGSEEPLLSLAAGRSGRPAQRGGGSGARRPAGLLPRERQHDFRQRSAANGAPEGRREVFVRIQNLLNLDTQRVQQLMEIDDGFGRVKAARVALAVKVVSVARRTCWAGRPARAVAMAVRAAAIAARTGVKGSSGAMPPGEIAGGADPDWWNGLSTEAEGESAANRDFVKGKGWKSPDDVVKSYREAERALRDSGRIKVPGEGASAEDVAAFNKAIGVPETVEGYALPEVKDVDGNVVPLDKGILGALLPKALERGVPAGAMNGLVADFVQLQLDEAAQFDADVQKAAVGWVGKQGAEGKEKMAAIDAAGRALGLNGKEMVAIRNALASVNGAEAGVAKTLDVFTRLGQGMAEDTIITGGRGRFGVTGREAQGELDQMKTKAGSDPAFAAAVGKAGTPENARWQRLQDQAAEWQRQQLEAGR